jgi:outer membrane receptor protein involved in Fe transport
MRVTSLLRSFLILVITATFTSAQTTTASFQGTVMDSSAAVLPGAQVTASNVETGLKRTTITNETGRFLLSELPPGSYEITVTLPGFETLVRKGMTLTIGQQANLNLSMNVGAVDQQVVVTGDAPIVETTQSAVAGVVEEKRITELPLNGRDFTQLALVEPAVVSLRNTGAGEIGRGFGTRMSVAGSRPDQTSWLLDGMNIKGSTQFGTPGSAGGGLLGVDGVREFQVLTTNYSAEFGGTSGGVVNMVTKSGTNQLHGTVYEFLRNSALDAAAWEDNAFGNGKPPFKRNQFGFSAGGPVRKDQTFFFFNYEGLRQPKGLTNVAFVPDENVHRGLVPNATGTGLQQVRIADSIAEILRLWPTPNVPGSSAGGVGLLSSSVSQRTTEDFFMLRVDHRLSERHSLFGRFSFDEASQTTPDLIPVDDIRLETHPRYGTVQLVSVWSPKLLTTTRVGVSRNNIALNLAMNVTYPKSVFFLSQEFPPEIQLPGAGLTNFGPDSSNVQAAIQQVYQLQESIAYTSGNNSYKFGFDFEKMDPNLNSGPNNNGFFRWATIADFLQDNPLQQLSTSLPGNIPERTFRQNYYGFYFSDDWKMNSKLTWNLGVRYEPYTAPSEKWDRVSVVKDWVTATHYDVGGKMFESPGKKYVAPRVGFAWDPEGNGKTAIRGGVGVFFVPLSTYVYSRAATRNAPFSGSIQAQPRDAQGRVANFASALSYAYSIAPQFLTPQFGPTTSPIILQYRPNATYEMKANLTIEQQIWQDFSASVGYIGGRGYHMTRTTDVNMRYPTIVNGRLFVDSRTPVPNPALFQGQMVVTDSQSFYNALRTQLKKRLSHDYQFQVSYTWSKTIDDATAGSSNTAYPTEGTSSQLWGTKADRGLSALNQTHNFVVNGIWNLPSPGGPKALSSVLGGWEATGIFTAVTGTPFTALMSGANVNDNGRPGSGSRMRMPDWVGGRSFSSVTSGTTAGCTFVNGIPGPYVAGRPNSVVPGQKLGSPSLWFDPCAFAVPAAGFYGNSGRGTFIGPGTVNFDMSLGKIIPLRREGTRLEFRSEFFNLFNRPNFADPASQVLNANNNSVITTVGQITRTVTPSRQLQFSLKLVF